MRRFLMIQSISGLWIFNFPNLEVYNKCSSPPLLFFFYLALRLFRVKIEAGLLTQRSQIIAVYALCGFANIGSMGIQLGGLGPLAPSRRTDLSELVFSAFISGTVACFMTACIAGILVE